MSTELKNFKDIFWGNKATLFGNSMRPIQPFLVNLKAVCSSEFLIVALFQSSTSVPLNQAIIALRKHTYSNGESASETLAALTPLTQKT